MSRRIEKPVNLEISTIKYDTIITFFDVDNLFVKRGASQNEVAASVEIYRQVSVAACQHVFENNGTNIRIAPAFLTTRPYLAFTDSRSNLHPLLGISATDKESYKPDKALEEEPVCIYCENGTVILAQTRFLDGPYIPLNNEYGVQVANEYKPYCADNGPRAHLNEAIKETGILSDIYNLEEGLLVFQSIQRKDKKRMTDDEKADLEDILFRYLRDHHSNDLQGDYGIYFDKSGNDLDILPKKAYEQKKAAAIIPILSFIKRHQLNSRYIKFYLGDDTYDIIKPLLDDDILDQIGALTKDFALLLPSNVDPRIKRFAQRHGIDLYESIHPTFIGLIHAVFETVTKRKLSIQYLEAEKLLITDKKNPIIVCIGDYARRAVDQENKSNPLKCEARIARFTNCRQLLNYLKYIKSTLDEATYITDDEKQQFFLDLLSGLQFVISANANNANNEMTYYNELMEYLSAFHRNGHPTPVILFNLTIKRDTLEHMPSTNLCRGPVNSLTKKVGRIKKDEASHRFTMYNVHPKSNPSTQVNPKAGNLWVEELIREID